MKRVPYIGITGFMSRQEVDEVMSVIPENANRKFMVGVLASPKTVAGLENKWPERYPKRDMLADIFPDNDKAFNLIHYGDGQNCQEGLGKRLIMVRERFGGPNMHGFQLNTSWPEAKEIREFKDKYPEMQIVLQAGAKSLKNTQKSAKVLAERFKKTYPNGEVDFLILT